MFEASTVSRMFVVEIVATLGAARRLSDDEISDLIETMVDDLDRLSLEPSVGTSRQDEGVLDAAHILPDGHPLGEPVVPNGLAMCKLHHAAFDRNILGVRPDLVVEIREDVLLEIDGPMLRHGLQDLDQHPLLVVPQREGERPNRAFLEERYVGFREAG
jgi:hypothetical protein